MGIVNRRNAVLGWMVWQARKRVVKKRAKAYVAAVDREAKKLNRGAIVAAVAAVGAGLMFWRKTGSDRNTPAE